MINKNMHYRACAVQANVIQYELTNNYWLIHIVSCLLAQHRNTAIRIIVAIWSRFSTHKTDDMSKSVPKRNFLTFQK